MTATEMVQPKKKKPPIFSHADDLAKVGTLALGILYILGLLVSNIQLMELGIADFASLQARNILIGVVFLFVISWLFIIVLPLAGIPTACGYVVFATSFSKRSKVALCVGAIVAAALSFAAIGYFAGLILGYLRPGGRPWIAGFQRSAFTWDFAKSDALAGWDQLLDIFAHPKFIVASVLVLIAEAIIIAVVMLYARGKKELISTGLQSSVIHVVGALFALMALLLVLFEYADEVYPNVRYNLGGGQPQIAELVLSGKRSEVSGLPYRATPALQAPAQVPTPATTQRAEEPDEAAITEDVAIWYQSDKFFYVAGLSQAGQKTTPVAAIDVKLVRAIRFLPKYIKVSSGSRIMSVRSY